MGTWSAKLDGNDLFMDVYDTFKSCYQEGKSPQDCTNEILIEYFDAGWDEIMDDDDHEEDLVISLNSHDDNDEIEIFLAIAKAQVDVGALHPYIYQFVRIIIETGTSLRLLKELGADELFLAERKEVLEQFLQIMKNQMNETRKPGQ